MRSFRYPFNFIFNDPPIVKNPDVLVGMKQFDAKVANPEKSEKRENFKKYF